VAAVGECLGASDLVPPSDGAGGEGVEQQLPQFAARYLGAVASALVGQIEQHRPCPVHDPVGLAAGQDELAEPLRQAGGLQCLLSVPGVDVEQATLAARVRRGFRLVDRGLDAVHVQHTGQHQAAETCSDDRDRCRHGLPHKLVGSATDPYWIVAPIS
jgi:hypothetical protein